jgi:hypothetical protein
MKPAFTTKALSPRLWNVLPKKTGTRKKLIAGAQAPEHAGFLLPQENKTIRVQSKREFYER